MTHFICTSYLRSYFIFSAQIPIKPSSICVLSAIVSYFTRVLCQVHTSFRNLKNNHYNNSQPASWQHFFLIPFLDENHDFMNFLLVCPPINVAKDTFLILLEQA